MEPLHLAHVILVSVWGGFVMAEGVLELTSREEVALRVAARVHYWMDLLAELPLLAGVLLTGTVLAVRAWPLSTLHWVKIAAGLIAIGANLTCVLVVILRYRRLDDRASLFRHSRHVRLTGVGVPFALLAAYLGLAFFRQ